MNCPAHSCIHSRVKIRTEEQNKCLSGSDQGSTQLTVLPLHWQQEMLFQQDTQAPPFSAVPSPCTSHNPSWCVRDVRKYMSCFSLYYLVMGLLCISCLILFWTCWYDLHPQTHMAVNCRSSLPTGERYFLSHVLNHAPTGLKTCL